MQNVEKLGQFVDARCPHKATEWRNAAIPRLGELRAVLLRVYDHAPEFHQSEFMIVSGIANLREKDRSAILQLDDERRNQHDRAGNDNSDQREHDIDQALNRSCSAKTCGSLH